MHELSCLQEHHETTPTLWISTAFCIILNVSNSSLYEWLIFAVDDIYPVCMCGSDSNDRVQEVIEGLV